MTEWKPKPKPDAKTEDLNLTGEEGFVLSRIDGFTSVTNLAHVTGLPEGRVKQIVHKLVRQGAIEAAAAEPPPSVGPARAARPPQPPEPQHRGGGGSSVTEIDEISPEELRAILADNTIDGDDDIGGGATEEMEPPAALASVPADVALPDAPEAQIDAPEEPERPHRAHATDDEDRPDNSGDDNSGDGKSDDDKSPDGKGEAEEANYRKLFNETLSKLEAPEREAMAHSGQDPQLMALCFDPLPAVIRGIFDNSRAGMAHARMVARHHRTPQGLDVIIARAEFFRDLQVQRFLLQNTMLQEPQLKRLLQSKRLAEVYKVTINREIPERNRQKSRYVLRSKWSTSDGEERAGLVFTTEGRCLQQLTGLPFDSQTTSLLCQKTYTSTLLIQNLARFGATPPPVLAHLMRQPVVKRQQHLRTLIKQHPNCPSDAKRMA